ncbi:MAG TPA: antibiotic biosynthesis monooxygenase family protein [Crinalium sp.]|jgi:quinol monooxygenase YgiN
MQPHHDNLAQAKQINLLVTFKVKPEMSHAFKQLLLNDLAHASQEDGYIAMNLFAAKDDPNTLFLLESWQNQEAFDHHLSQPHTEAVLKLAETALTNPMQLCFLENLSSLSQPEVSLV